MFWLNAFKSLTAAAVLATVGWTGAASATTVSATGSDTWSSTLTCAIDSNCAGVSATLTFAVQGNNDGTWNVDLTILNSSSQYVTDTTSSTGFLTAVGFNTDPNATMSNFLTISGPTGWDGGAGSVPSTNTELCVWDGNSCSGSNNHSMTYGVQSEVSFLLTSTGTSLSFDGYAVKVAGVGPNNASYEFGPNGVSTVPLPATGLLLMGALGGLGLVKRRRRKAA